MITNSYLRIIAWSAVFIGIAAALNIISVLYAPLIRPILQVLVPFAIAVALALLLDPTIERLHRGGLSRGLSVFLVAAMFVLVFVVIGIILVPIIVKQATELADNFPEYYRQAQMQVNSFMEGNRGLLRRFQLPTTTQELSSGLADELQSAARSAVASAGAILGSVVSKAFWLIIIPIITVFVLIDIDRMKSKLLLLAPERHRDRAAGLASSVGQVFGAYIRGLIAMALLYGIVCGVTIGLFGVPYAVMLGAAAGALSLVPYIGTISTILLVALVAFVSQPANPLHALYVAVAILVINQLFDNVLTPRIVGKAVGLHPALAILALLVGAQLFGIVGMILAVPVAASIQLVVLEFYPPLRS